MDYTEVRFYNDASLNEAIIAWLGESDYDMFEERSDGLNAYIEAGKFRESLLNELLKSIPDSEKNIRWETSFIKDQNWNTKWESNFEPVLVAGRVFIRAPFHKSGPEFQHEIIIEPKMSFGTGHHATTALMIELMLDMDFRNKSVADVGSGTGILSIMAEKLGANRIVSVDIDEWAYNNCLENFGMNDARKIEARLGDVSLIAKEKFDIILANINRNILLRDMNNYRNSLNNGGTFLLSGILKEDKEVINQSALSEGLTYVTEAGHENWLAMRYRND